MTLRIQFEYAEGVG